MIRGRHAYAELHYAPAGPAFSRLWQDWPEIYADTPWLVFPGDELPLLLTWRDAHRFPCRVHSLRLRWVDPAGATGSCALDFEAELHQELDGAVIGRFRPGGPGSWDLWIEGIAEQGGRRMAFVNQLARPFAELPLRITAAPGPDPGLPGLAWGDLQAHGSATRDTVEFGPPPELLYEAARTLGLGWFCITDHSYDLDRSNSPDAPPGPDPAQPRWHDLKRRAAALNAQAGPTVLVGEELSCRGLEGGILHLLLLEPERLLAGSPDGGQGLPFRRPEHDLLSALAALGPRGLAVASHPGEGPGRLEHLLLRRRDWSPAELRQLGHWQALNGTEGPSLRKGLRRAVSLWAEGRPGVLLAGNDSHGHFALARELTLPLWAARSHREHLFGRHRSGLLLPGGVTPDGVLGELRAGRVLLGNGPLLCFTDSRGEPVFQPEAGPRELLARAGGRLGAIRVLDLLAGGPSGERILERHRPDQDSWQKPLPEPPAGGWLRARLVCDQGFALTQPLFHPDHPACSAPSSPSYPAASSAPNRG
jgi:hypothetical protein